MMHLTAIIQGEPIDAARELNKRGLTATLQRVVTSHGGMPQTVIKLDQSAHEKLGEWLAEICDRVAPFPRGACLLYSQHNEEETPSV